MLLLLLKGDTIRRADSEFVGDSTNVRLFISVVDGDNSSVLVLTFSFVDVELSTLILFSLSSIIIINILLFMLILLKPQPTSYQQIYLLPVDVSILAVLPLVIGGYIVSILYYFIDCDVVGLIQTQEIGIAKLRSLTEISLGVGRRPVEPTTEY